MTEWTPPEGFRTQIGIQPAFDKRAPEPHKNYGIGEMRMCFYLIGPKGAVQWMIGTNWYVDTARKHLATFPPNSYDRPYEPRGWDLGYHALEAQYDGQTPHDCNLIDGGKCYYDGSGLNAELLVERFLEGGLEYLWPALLAYYTRTFEDGPWPFEAETGIARNLGRYV